MLVLGIDPGTAHTGYGFIKVEDTTNGHKNLIAVDWGIIETDKAENPAKRLSGIYESMHELFKKYSPDAMAMEKLFFANNAKTAIRVGQAQGVMLLSTSSYNVEVFEYAPGTIKKMVAGSGTADKKDMQKSLRKVFGARVRSDKKKRTHFDNAADGLAVALCHIYSVNGMGGDE
jgi:crossover junction endodeoxyribonuclease RuvC